MAIETPYLVEIEEHYKRTVVVWAESEEEANAAAEELYESGDIDLSRNSFVGLEIGATGVATKAALDTCEQFWAD